jgi:BlaI family transcriptional regulator, penicillinase repressor
MTRPAARDLTERELEVMHVYWRHGPLTASAARDLLAQDDRILTYTTVANLVRILHEKSFLEQTNEDRPFVYAPARSYEEVSGRLLGDVVERVFRGSREQLLLRLLGTRQLSSGERDFLENLLKEESA